MNYALITCVNGTFKIESEHGDNIEQARTAWYAKGETLSNAPDVRRSRIRVVDENLLPVMGLDAEIGHDAPEEPVVPEEPAEDDEAEPA
jgi:hypothetical protein